MPMARPQALAKVADVDDPTDPNATPTASPSAVRGIHKGEEDVRDKKVVGLEYGVVDAEAEKDEIRQLFVLERDCSGNPG